MSKRAVDELTAQLTELREALALLQAVVKDQQEDLQQLKAQVQRLEHENAHSPSALSSGASTKFAPLVRSGACPLYSVYAPCHASTCIILSYNAQMEAILIALCLEKANLSESTLFASILSTNAL